MGTGGAVTTRQPWPHRTAEGEPTSDQLRIWLAVHGLAVDHEEAHEAITGEHRITERVQGYTAWKCRKCQRYFIGSTASPAPDCGLHS